MNSRVVLVCSKCGGLSAAKAEQISKICPYCGLRIVLKRTKIVAAADSAVDASKLLKRLKREAGEKRKSQLE